MIGTYLFPKSLWNKPPLSLVSFPQLRLNLTPFFPFSKILEDCPITHFKNARVFSLYVAICQIFVDKLQLFLLQETCSRYAALLPENIARHAFRNANLGVLNKKDYGPVRLICNSQIWLHLDYACFLFVTQILWEPCENKKISLEVPCRRDYSNHPLSEYVWVAAE